MTKSVSARGIALHPVVTTNRPNIIRLTLDDTLHRASQSAQVAFDTNAHVTIRVLAGRGKMNGGTDLWSALS